MNTNFHPGNRVLVRVVGWHGTFEHGTGTVTKRHEGINLLYSIKLDSGKTGTFGWKHVSAAA